jgi:hypothetical protein
VHRKITGRHVERLAVFDASNVVVRAIAIPLLTGQDTPTLTSRHFRELRLFAILANGPTWGARPYHGCRNEGGDSIPLLGREFLPTAIAAQACGCDFCRTQVLRDETSREANVLWTIAEQIHYFSSFKRDGMPSASGFALWGPRSRGGANSPVNFVTRRLGQSSP